MHGWFVPISSTVRVYKQNLAHIKYNISSTLAATKLSLGTNNNNMLNYRSAKNHGYLLNSTFFRNLFFTKMCIIRAVLRNIHTQQIIILVTFHVLTIIDLSGTSILIISKLFIDFSSVGQTLSEKAVFEKNELSWTSVPASCCTFQSMKSAMRPTFQNIDCFKDKMASITGMLIFSTVNPENFSLIPLYHPENEANFWLPNTLKRTMFTPDFLKEGKMQAVSTHEAWNWPCWFSFMCHSQLTTIVKSNFHGRI